MLKAWEFQKRIMEDKIISYGDFYNLCKEIENPRDRALMVITYLTAGRCSEIVRHNVKDSAKYFKAVDIEKVNVPEKGKEVIRFYIRNKKNKREKYKHIPVDIMQERAMLGLFLEYWQFMAQQDRKAPFFDISRARAYQIIRKYGFNPHFLRHIRLTHKASMSKYTDQQLVKYAGWTDSRPAKHYIKLDWKDLI